MGRVSFVVLLLVVSTSFAGGVAAWINAWPARVSLEILDWNFVSAVLSLWSFLLTILALGFADMQWSQHTETQQAVAKALAPALRGDFGNSMTKFDPRGPSITQLIRAGVADAPGRAIAATSAHTSAIELFLGKPDIFGNDAPEIARAAAAVLSANAALGNLARMPVTEGNHPAIQTMARRAAELAHYAYDQAQIASDKLAKWDKLGA